MCNDIIIIVTSVLRENRRRPRNNLNYGTFEEPAGDSSPTPGRYDDVADGHIVKGFSRGRKVTPVAPIHYRAPVKNIKTLQIRGCIYLLRAR